MSDKIGSSTRPVYINPNGVPVPCGKDIHEVSIEKRGRQNGKVLFTFTINDVTTEIRDDLG